MPWAWLLWAPEAFAGTACQFSTLYHWHKLLSMGFRQWDVTGVQHGKAWPILQLISAPSFPQRSVSALTKPGLRGAKERKNSTLRTQCPEVHCSLSQCRWDLQIFIFSEKTKTLLFIWVNNEQIWTSFSDLAWYCPWPEQPQNWITGSFQCNEV